MTSLLVFLIRVYQLVGSPLLRALCGAGSGCRFEPSCSEYFIQALRGHGCLKGLALGFRRIGRCHPWGGSGYDPVPVACKSHH